MENKSFDESKYLNEDSAHNEANMIKAHLNKDAMPLWSERVAGVNWEEYIEHSASPEDYDDALKAIEDLQRLSREEPVSSKILYGLGRILHNAARIPGFYLFFVATIGQIPPDAEKHDLAKIDTWLSDKLSDASKKLRELKSEAHLYAKAESAEKKDEELT